MLRFAPVALACLVFTVSCEKQPVATPSGSAGAGLPDRDPTLACRLVRKQGAVLIDTRTREEYDGGHVEGAISVPHDQTAERIEEIRAAAGDNLDRPIVVYCGSGRRAGLAKQTLVEQGFRQVTNVGGMADWIDDC